MLNGGKYSVCESILLGQKSGLQLRMLNIYNRYGFGLSCPMKVKYVVAIPYGLSVCTRR